MTLNEEARNAGRISESLPLERVPAFLPSSFETHPVSCLPAFLVGNAPGSVGNNTIGEYAIGQPEDI
jgi:hypothetical protein